MAVAAAGASSSSSSRFAAVEAGAAGASRSAGNIDRAVRSEYPASRYPSTILASRGSSASSIPFRSHIERMDDTSAANASASGSIDTSDDATEPPSSCILVVILFSFSPSLSTVLLFFFFCQDTARASE